MPNLSYSPLPGRASITRVRLPIGLSLLLALTTSCVLPEPRAEVEFSYADFTGGGAPPSWLSIRYDDGTGERELRVDAGTQEGIVVMFPRRRTATTGLLHVRAALVRAPGDTAAKASVALTLRPDWRWGVDLFTAAGAYDEPCNGCIGHQSFPFRIAPDRSSGSPPLIVPDSLHVVWGGTSISRVSVY
jgi:hypothetical protein